MLQIKNVKKSYTTGDFTQHALKGVSLDFRKNEFVAILGPSGSGKTTLLNIIGGLDRYDAGDLIINNKSTKKFKDTEWDAYRNNCIGFIFQSYNLISHISVLENVEMGMTLSGVSLSKRKKKALEVLDRVGLREHAHKKPNQLSGGQMQRVAIARALANDPDIILADEPTGALDSKTSVQIMELITEIAKDKLVIMVTHNPDLAKEYATRIIELKDGELISDSNPIKDEEKSKKKFNIKKTAMSFLTALNLSFNNIKTKKGRTFITAFASSIGIIGIALILALSNGFDIQIDKFERDTLSSMPIMISSQAMEMNEENMENMHNMMVPTGADAYSDEKYVYPQKPMTETILHKNDITNGYVDYIEKIDNDLISGISYNRATSLNIIGNVNGTYKPIVDQTFFASIPKKLDETSTSGVIEDNYDILAGTIPSNKNELILIVDSKNRISTEILNYFNLDIEQEKIDFEKIIGCELKLILNNNYYRSLGEYYTLNTNYEELYNSNSAETLKIVGIARGKEGNMLVANGNGIGYTEELVEFVIDNNKNSDIVKKQQEVDYNILTGEKFDNDNETSTKDMILSYLGADSIPMLISVYPKDFESKDQIISYLDDYNENKSDEEKILYTDMGSMISTLSGGIMDAITVVLIAFSSISLVVSSIMIGIITYISVLERTKEIGVLRALGARKKDIRRVFNAETFIIGICSGALGIIIARLLVFPANAIIENLTDLADVAKLNPLHALMLVAISVLLTVIGGYIPAKVASKKDPVESLRSE
ncbi:MAG: ABC transporter ATP-binding protein/permease [Bacilli bacterium]|nr:ABC transporter ATP-binding protein/permease [Bacilli bacterium]